MSNITQGTIDTVNALGKYEAGFVTDIESDKAPKGLTEEIVRFISAKKGEPEWLLDWRLKAFRHWQKMPEPQWGKLNIRPIDYQDSYYYAAPKQKLSSLDEADPKLLATFEKLGVPMAERARLAGVAVDVVFDSVSVATTFRKQLAEVGIIFCSISDAVKDHPDLVKKYMGSVVPYHDNKHACLNSAVFTDGSFCYIPPGVRCRRELFRQARCHFRKLLAQFSEHAANQVRVDITRGYTLDAGFTEGIHALESTTDFGVQAGLSRRF